MSQLNSCDECGGDTSHKIGCKKCGTALDREHQLAAKFGGDPNMKFVPITPVPVNDNCKHLIGCKKGISCEDCDDYEEPSYERLVPLGNIQESLTLSFENKGFKIVGADLHVEVDNDTIIISSSGEIKDHKKKSVNDKYHELLMAVGNKFVGESRHETALRYIMEAESRCSGVGSDNKDSNEITNS